MDLAENREPVTISFKLTRWQRVLNPIERLLYALLGLPLLAILPIALMAAHDSTEVLLTMILALGLLVFWALPTSLFLRTIFSDSGYVDRIEIHDDFVSYRLPPFISVYPENASDCKQPRITMTLTKGLCGTFVLRDILDGRKTIVLPRTCATYDQLKQLFPGPKGDTYKLPRAEARYLEKLNPITFIGEPSPRSRRIFKTCALPKLQEREQFDGFASSLQRLGWMPFQNADGPDARICTFSREGKSLWLVFDDILGGSLKSEHSTVDLQTLAKQLETPDAS